MAEFCCLILFVQMTTKNISYIYRHRDKETLNGSDRPEKLFFFASQYNIMLLVYNKSRSRVAAHAAISLRLSVKSLLKCLYKDNKTLTVLLYLWLDPPLYKITRAGNSYFKIIYYLLYIEQISLFWSNDRFPICCSP